MRKVLNLIIIFLFTLRVFYPVFSYADEATGSATLTPTVSPTMTPTETPIPIQEPTIDASNSAQVTTSVDNTSNTGNNTITGDATASATPTPIASGPTSQENATATATPTPEASTTINTGNAITTTNAENTVNTNLQNSQVEFQTINIFLNSNNSLDLGAPLTVAAEVASTSATPSANILMTSTTNYATLNNDITAVGNTGDNNASGSGKLIINTGNAYSLVQLLNKVNLTLVNSTIHIVTVNIYGTLNGNIILPDTSTPTDSAIQSLTATNDATVTNTIQNNSNTGGNTALTTGSANITTGNATSIVNVTNIINTILLNANFEHLYINTFGQWQGNFLGWDTLNPQQGGGSMDLVKMPDNSGNNNVNEGSINVSNNANVTNTISNTANTGGNSTNGGSSSISTGNAYGYVNLMNFINSLFVNSHGFLGFINIFGTLNGNIGGQSAFVTPTPTPTPTPSENTQNVSTDITVHKEDGGALALSTYNNVGAYVLPGDTVTFFATVKNAGTGMVYGTTLHIELMQDGQDLGGADYTLGDIPTGHGIKLSTGLVLSKNAPYGPYTAVVTAEGTTGDANTQVGASADSYFTVQGTIVPLTNVQNINPTMIPTPSKEPTREILGVSTKQTTNTDLPLYYALITILLAYMAVRILRAHQQLLVIFARNKTLKERVSVLRLFLL